MTETHAPYGHYGPPGIAAPDAALYEQYDIVGRINGWLIAIEDGYALILSNQAMPHYVTDETASAVILDAARLVVKMRDRWLRGGNLAGAPEAGGGEGEL